MVDRQALEKELLAQAPRQWKLFEAKKKKLRKTKSKHQREMEDLEKKVAELKRKYMADPALREINRKFMERLKPENASKLVCPSCGEGDKGNRMNSKPWCFKCKTVLLPKDKMAKWMKEPTIKVLGKSMKDELKRLNPGLNPDNKDDL